MRGIGGPSADLLAQLLDVLGGCKVRVDGIDLAPMASKSSAALPISASSLA
jgi:hypothetical protein